MNDTIAVTRKRTNTSLVIAVLVAAVAVVVGSVFVQRLLPPAQVYLSKAPWNDNVEMFISLQGEVGDDYYTFPDRTPCTVITDLDYYRVDSGPLMAFYKLDCGGKVGYVHADRVSRY